MRFTSQLCAALLVVLLVKFAHNYRTPCGVLFALAYSSLASYKSLASEITEFANGQRSLPPLSRRASARREARHHRPSETGCHPAWPFLCARCVRAGHKRFRSLIRTTRKQRTRQTMSTGPSAARTRAAERTRANERTHRHERARERERERSPVGKCKTI